MELSKNQEQLVEQNQSLQHMRDRMLIREERSMESFRRYLDGIANLQRFMKATSPDVIISALNESKDRTAILDDWMTNMQKEGKRPNNIKSMLMGVKKFLQCNRVNDVDWKFIGKPKVSIQIRDRIATSEELRRVLSNKTSLRDRALFMMAVSSGLRIGTIASLKVGDLTPYENTAFVTVAGGKGRKLAKGKEYHTWVTPEAFTTIQDYLKTRNNPDKDAPLFCKVNNGDEGISIYPQNIARLWLKMIKRAKLFKKIENHSMYDLHVHTLRKFFQTRSKLAGCETRFVDLWLGHTASEYLNGSYFRPDIRESYNEYKKAISDLTIFGKEELELHSVKTKLETENQELRKEISDLRQQLTPLFAIAKLFEQYGIVNFTVPRDAEAQIKAAKAIIAEHERNTTRKKRSNA